MKNLTSTWYYDAGFRDYSVPTPVLKQNITITIKGLSAGTYTIERWSTTDTNPATQKQQPDVAQTITQGQDLTFTVNSLGTTTDYDWAYKIYK